MGSEIILAFDPGQTTGYAYANYSISQHRIERLVAGEMTFPELVQQWASVPFSTAKVVIVEDWRIYPNKRGAFVLQHQWAPEMIGVIRALALEHNNLDDVVRQMASQAKHQWPNDRLEAHGYDTRGHAKDALRHLLTYCENRLAVDLIDRSEPI
jgi:hypothetical protein